MSCWIILSRVRSGRILQSQIFEIIGLPQSNIFEFIGLPQSNIFEVISRVSNIESDNSQNVGLEDYNNISDGIFPHFSTQSKKISLG